MKVSRVYGAVVTAVLSLAASSPVLAQTVVPSAISAVRTASGLKLQTAQGVVEIEVWSDRDIHVRAYAGSGWSPYTPAVIGHPAQTAWTMTETPDAYSLTTGALKVRVDRQTGNVSFSDLQNNTILDEAGRKLSDTAITQSFGVDSSSAIYGLGQHQGGLMDYRGNSVRLQQANSDVGVPMLVASRGFGILWNNASVTTVDAGLPQDGHALKISSEAGGGIDYHFFYGPEVDQVIAEYRKITGDAPMMARWTWGLWQSKERYKTQAELLSVAAKYRELKIPFDAVVQDWQYWAPGDWGDHVKEPARYPDPKAMVKTLHDEHVHAVISVWPRFDLGTDNLAELDKAGAAFPKVYPNVYPAGEGRWYDPYGAAGRAVYWKQISRTLGSYGFDGWWLDASEGELGGQWGQMREVKTAAGPGAVVYNAYPLMHTTAVHDGALKDYPEKRPILLTRSAYAGQQRNAAITWSGDTVGRWDVFKRQIPAGLNFSISGIPYWSADIGGFFGGAPSNPRYAELFTRWYQFAVFNPMFRIHGTGEGKEIWQFDKPTQDILIEYDHLRYRLLPYIYSASWDVTHNQGTMMRPLVMDFREDTTALTISDEYMFGKAILVAPVTQPKAEVRTVYLPGQGGWFDFWTGARYSGGQTVAARADIKTLPLYVRAGTILPLGPVVQYADQPTAEATELRIYPGQDGAYTLYDDAGDGFGFEKGQFALVRFKWTEATRTLDIAARDGQFPGVMPGRTFRIVCATGGGAKDLAYSGQAIRVSLPDCGA